MYVAEMRLEVHEDMLRCPIQRLHYKSAKQKSTAEEYLGPGRWSGIFHALCLPGPNEPYVLALDLFI